MSRSPVCSSAARWMIRSSAARSIRAGVPSPMLFLRRRPGLAEAELGHEAGEVAGGKGGARSFGVVGPGRRRTRRRRLLRLEEGLEQLDRNREDRGRVVLRGDLGDRLEIAELNGARLLGECAGG